MSALDATVDKYVWLYQLFFHQTNLKNPQFPHFNIYGHVRKKFQNQVSVFKYFNKAVKGLLVSL